MVTTGSSDEDLSESAVFAEDSACALAADGGFAELWGLGTSDCAIAVSSQQKRTTPRAMHRQPGIFSSQKDGDLEVLPGMILKLDFTFDYPKSPAGPQSGESANSRSLESRNGAIGNASESTLRT
jgi:hypothetical protein